MSPNSEDRNTPSPQHQLNNPEFVALQDINAQISPPNECSPALSQANSLETIFEGVFLSTPPRCQRPHSRSNLLEKVLLQRLQQNNKENQSPQSKSAASSDSQSGLCLTKSGKSHNNTTVKTFEEIAKND